MPVIFSFAEKTTLFCAFGQVFDVQSLRPFVNWRRGHYFASLATVPFRATPAITPPAWHSYSV